MANISAAHPEWQDLLGVAIKTMSMDYLRQLDQDDNWLPGPKNVFAAFTAPLSSMRYILLGESPYPRAQSANGYAFWDASVDSLWSLSGLSKDVNRATSLRNLIKMLLHARGDLHQDFSQAAIAQLDKSRYVETGAQLFGNFLQRGFLLLNASLAYSDNKVAYHARQWRPFMASLFHQLKKRYPNIQLILLGNIARQVPESLFFRTLIAEHPYNLSFITNPQVVDFFRPLAILDRQI